MSNVIGFISCFVMFIVEYINLCDITKKQYNINIKNLSIIFFMSIVNFFAIFVQPVIVKITISVISIYFINKYIIGNDEEESISSTAVYYLLVIIIELLFSLVLVNLFRINSVKFVFSKGYMKSIISVIMSFILLFVARFKIVNFIFTKLVKILRKLNIKPTSISILVIGICLIQMIYVYNVAVYKSFISIAYILLFIVIVIYFSLSIYRNYYLKVLNEILKNNDEKMNILLNEYKMFKHNTRHQLIAIASVGNQKVKKMVDTYLNDFNVSSEYNCNVSTMPVGLRGVIYEKLVSYNNLNIQIDNYLKKDPIDVLPASIYSRVVQSISILLDNAIEYSAGASENNYIYLFFDETESEYKIHCINRISGNIHLENEKVISDLKVKKMGVGHEYIKNKTLFNFNISIKNNSYKTSLIIKK